MFIMAAAILNGCKKEEDETTDDSNTTTPATKSVYVCGYEINSAGNNVAKYWKDGIENTLSNGATDAVAQNIWVEGDDVYVVGSRKEFNAGSLTFPAYWLNGVETLLNGTSAPYSSATDIFISNDNVYIVGYERNSDGIEVAKLWMNGGLTNLSDGSSEAKAFGVYVENGNVHVVGTQNVSEFDNTPVAMYWLNGVGTELTDGETDAEAMDVEVSNGDVYICGVVVSDSGVANNMLWKNGEPQYTVEDGLPEMAHGLCVVGNDVYIAGKNENQTCSSGYWKNGGFITLIPAVSFMSLSPIAGKIVVDNDDVYATGSYSSDGVGTNGVYWKNGVAHHPGSTPFQEGLLGIFIK